MHYFIVYSFLQHLQCVFVLLWNGYVGYEVQKLPVKGHGDWTPVNTKPISGTTFTVPNLIEGSEFEFRVVAINDAGPGKPSKSTGPHKVRDPICTLHYYTAN